MGGDDGIIVEPGREAFHRSSVVIVELRYNGGVNNGGANSGSNGGANSGANGNAANDGAISGAISGAASRRFLFDPNSCEGRSGGGTLLLSTFGDFTAQKRA